MNVLILSQLFDPETTIKGVSFARALEARGHHVEVLTGFPNYPNGIVFPGYRIRAVQRETIEGIRVNRVPLYPSHDRSGVRRALSYASFASSAAAFGPLLTRRPDVIYVYNLVTLGVVAMALRALRGSPFVLDVQDLWPDSVANSGMMRSPTAMKALGGICGEVYRRADHITVLSPGMRDELVRRGIRPERLSVIYNWCDATSMRSAPPNPETVERLGLHGCFTVLFAGTMGIVQDLRSVLDAAELLAAKLPLVRFLFVGGGVQRDSLAREARLRGLDNVSFLARVPAAEMPALFGLADALLVHLQDSPLFRITVPSKTQAYLAAGKPIIMGVQGDAADLVTRAGAGVLCKPGDALDIAAGIQRLYALSEDARRRMGDAGAAFYKKELSMERGVEKFEAVFEAVGVSGASRADTRRQRGSPKPSSGPTNETHSR